MLRAGLVAAGSLCCAAAGYPVVRFLGASEPSTVRSTAWVDVGSVAELPPGSARLVLVAGSPAVVVRRPDASIRAFSAVCTHLGCTVQYRADRDALVCGCHGAEFSSTTGTAMRGPSLVSLPALVAEVRDGRILVSL